MKPQLELILGEGTIREQVDLFPYLFMRLHSRAQYFFEAKTKDDLLHAIQASHKLSIPLIMLGGGSNLVFRSSEVAGLIVKNSYADTDTVHEDASSIDIEVGSGTNMAILVQYLCEKGYSGLEYQKGLPGTVGGALYMNSKWTHPVSYVGDCLLSATIADKKGQSREVDKEYFAFAYDYSKLQDTHEYIISATLRLQKSESAIVTQHAQEALAYRNKTQPSGKPTCGCFFKNITEDEQKVHSLPTKSAGYLIDKAGLKGTHVGSFAVSDIHANFIVNLGGESRPEDLVKLTHIIKEKVQAQFGIQLEEEVRII